MPSNLQFSATLTGRELNCAVNSFIHSTKFMKKLVPLLATNILCHRIKMDDKLFSNVKIETLEYAKLNRNSKSAYIRTFQKGMQSVAAAIEAKNLKEFTLTFQKDHKDIEHYKFRVVYNEYEVKTKISSKFYIESTKQLLDEIKCLSEDRYIGTIDDVGTMMNMKFYRRATRSDLGLFTITQKLFRIQNFVKYRALGCVNTGHHKMKCFTSVAETEKGDARSVAVAETKEPADGTQSPKSSLFENLSFVGELISFPFEIRCPCTLTVPFQFTDLIRCTVCSSLQHVACVGYDGHGSVPSPYVCVFCPEANADVFLTKTTRDKWAVVCTARLAVFEVYVKNSLPTEVLERLTVGDTLNNVKAVLIGITNSNTGEVKPDMLKMYLNNLFNLIQC